MLKKFLLALCLLWMPAIVAAQVSELGKPTKLLTTESIVNTTVLSSDTVYWIRGFTYVEPGEKLVIEPGTIIKGMPGQGLDASALVIQMDAKIDAQGTQFEPIIFTCSLDVVDDPNDFPDDATSKGQWGGVIILGKTAISTATGTAYIEGIPQDPRTLYGGGATPDDDDSSGVFRYVSIRYPGSILSTNNEINGLTLGAVGRKTVIDHVEVYYSADDDIEFFGGTVNCFYLVGAFGDDDCFDTDQGYRGTLQFLLEVKDPRWGDRLTEDDGGDDKTSCVTCTPYGRMKMVNGTMIAQGHTGSTATSGNRMFWNDYAGGYMYNNIFMEQPKGIMEINVKGGDAGIDDPGSSTAWLPGSVSSIANGYPGLDFVANFFYLHGGSGTSYDSIYATSKVPLATQRVRDAVFPAADLSLAGKNHGDIDPELLNPSNWYIRRGGFDPRPIPLGNAASGAQIVPQYADPQGDVVAVDYRGAFAPDEPLWTNGWTALSTYGFITCCDFPGDANSDQTVNVGDAVFIINYVFKGGEAPSCMQEADANADATVNVGDAVSLINFVFKGGDAPVCSY